MNLNAQQIRAARNFVGWSQTDLAEKTRLSLRTIKRAESGGELTPSADFAVRRALESEGLEFFTSADEISGKDVVLGVAMVRR